MHRLSMPGLVRRFRFIKILAIVYTMFRLYVAAFPTACAHPLGPNSLQCYVGLWTDVGCALSGRKNPQNLNADFNVSLNAMTITCGFV